MGVTGARATVGDRGRGAGRAHPRAPPTCRSASGSASPTATRPPRWRRYADGVIVGSAFVRAARGRRRHRRRPGPGRRAGRRRPPRAAGDLERATARSDRAPLTRSLRRPSPAPPRASGTSGRFPVRAYALCILAGIVVAVWIGDRRWRARGGREGRGPRHRRLGGAVRHRRRPALPRDHLPGSRTSARAATRSRPSTSGRAASASGARSRSAASARGSAAAAHGDPAAAVRRRARARAVAGPGDRPVGQLVQQRAVRPPDRPAVGAARSTVDARRHAVSARRAARGRGTFHPTFLYELLWDVGVAVLIVWVDRRLQARPRPALRALRARLHGRPRLDRGPADRPGQPRPRAAAQRLDSDRSWVSAPSST